MSKKLTEKHLDDLARFNYLDQIKVVSVKPYNGYTEYIFSVMDELEPTDHKPSAE